MAFEYVGSCRIYAGDPTVALGAGMVDLGFLEDVTVDLGIRLSGTSNSNLAGVLNSASIYALPADPRIQAQIKDGAIAQLGNLVLGSVETTDAGPPETKALGLGSSFKQIPQADVPTICIVADSQKGDGSSATQAIWLPAALPQGVNGFTFNRPQQGEIGNTYNTEFQTAYRDSDQAAAAIPDGYRTGFIGDPAAIGLAWSLPAGA